MLEALRKGAGGIVAKIFIGVLALSFAVWGISDVFTGRQTGALVTVGDEKIFEREFQTLFQNQIRLVSQRTGQQLSLAQARERGLDLQVLTRLIQRAALDNEARGMQLGLSDKVIAGSITKLQPFQDTQGRFDRLTFDRYLQSQGLTEAGFIIRQRRDRLRGQLGSAVQAELSVPDVLARALYVHSKEIRKADYFILPKSSVRPPADPSDKDINDFYNANKARFTAPEYRAITLLKLEPKDLVPTIALSEDDLRKAFKDRAAEFIKPERRTIEQIVFNTKQEAEKAAKRLKDGMDFLALAKELKHKKVDIELGDLAAKDIPDAKFAKAAFALKLSQISEPIVSPLKIAIVRVTKITPEVRQTFEQVKAKLKQGIALERAQDEVLNLHDTVEDERAGGASLKDISEKLNLPLIVLKAVDRSGRGTDRKQIKTIPNGPAALQLAFSTGVGVETDPLDTAKEGFVWLDVNKITKSAVRPLKDVRTEAVDLWKQGKLRERLVAKARGIVKSINSTPDLAARAKELDLTVKTTKDLSRQATDKDFGAPALASLFLTAKDKAAQAPAKGGGIVIFRTIKVDRPVYAQGTKDILALKRGLNAAMQQDLIAQYISAVQSKAGVDINQTIWRRLRGEGS
jgi:peptidyl-prolyl cis-trans isomerase D